MTGWPAPADFPGPPSAADLAAWEDADREARPARLGRLRARIAAAGVDAYFGVRREHMRYLTGFTLAEGEEKVAGNSGQFLVSPDEVVVLADSRYTIQARREAPDARLFEAYHDLPTRWPELVASAGARRIAVEAGFVSHATWQRLAEAAPAVELVPVEGWVEADRAVKEPAELERIAAACAVADRALAALLPRDPRRRDGGRARAAPGVADPDGRRRGARLRRGLPRRPAGRPAARGARRSARPGRPGPAVRLRGAGRRLPERHDPNPVRRRAGSPRPRGLRAGGARPGRRRSRRSRRPCAVGEGRPARQSCRAAAPSMPSLER